MNRYERLRCQQSRYGSSPGVETQVTGVDFLGKPEANKIGRFQAMRDDFQRKRKTLHHFRPSSPHRSSPPSREIEVFG